MVSSQPRNNFDHLKIGVIVIALWFLNYTYYFERRVVAVNINEEKETITSSSWVLYCHTLHNIMGSYTG